MIYRPYSDNKATTIRIHFFHLWIHCIEYLEDKNIWKIYYDHGTYYIKSDGYQDVKASSYTNKYITIEGVDFPPSKPMEKWPQNEYDDLNGKWNQKMEALVKETKPTCSWKKPSDCNWDKKEKYIQLKCLWSKGYTWQETKEWGLWFLEKITQHNQLKLTLKF